MKLHPVRAKGLPNVKPLRTETKKPLSITESGFFISVRLNVQLSHHFLDDMRLLANLLKDFDER